MSEIIDLIRKKTDKELTYINTVEFIDELTELREQGVNDNLLNELIDCNKFFDIYGNDSDTEYHSNVILVYTLPVIHPLFNYIDSKSDC